ncbi:MAG: FxLYD domain-containing protein, partial [Thermomicrobiaceae bacterium]
ATVLALVVLGTLFVPALPASEIGTYAFEQVWWRTDLPVRENQADRTWVWGPEPITPLLLEPYDEGHASGMEGTRWVQYFDKTRVEITRSDGDQGNDWYVTNGLLARELISGRMQFGDFNAVEYEPAEINVAGDSNDPDGPTYRSLNQVREAAPLQPGSIVTQTINRDGSIGNTPGFADYGISTDPRTDQTNRTIASVFWEFMNAEGTIYDGFDFVDGRLFEDPFFATGLPITEPYWTTVRVGGEPRDVLIQAFERRVLTFTPGNPEGWTVEAANVGRHYHQWRYSNDGDPALTTSEITETRDLSDNLIFMGEVENSSRAPFGGVEIELTISDEAGEPIESFRTYLDASMVEPGERFPFQIWTEYPGDYASYDVAVNSRPSHLSGRPDVAVNTVHADWASSNRYEINGVVRNDSGTPVSYLQYVVALYNGDGQVVDYRWGMIDPVELAPGQEVPFDTFFFEPETFSEYRVFISN